MYDRVILASKSPRRRELLSQLGLRFEVVPARGAELSAEEDPGAYVEDLASAKAREVASSLFSSEEDAGTVSATENRETENRGGILVLGADTIVVKNGEILGKPKDPEDATRMLSLLSGTSHRVLTGICLILIENGRRIERRFHETTHVDFAELTPQEIADYVASNDPMDKAGAYGIQSGAARFVTGIRGDYNNVVGLPIARLYQELKSLGQDRPGESPNRLGEEPNRLGEESGRSQEQGQAQVRGDDIEKAAQAESRLDRQFDFLRELDREKNIFRQNYIGGQLRRENDAEHAWHMALMAAVLREYANEPVNLERVLLMILLHDVVEIDAGDTYAYDEEGKKSQEERERAAADRIFRILPSDQAVYFRGLWDEFEAWQSPEARFARACDNFQPLMLNAMNHGQSWLDHGICLSQVLGRNARSGEGAGQVWSYAYEHFILKGIREGKLIDDRETGGTV